ncbi:hypothetical protein QQF64_027293 [Cirrhinus molitorella]|uniref:Uncharacterized protein n=1 Tax=Cirrhinus molitorella TaxID=172907 RepID=A0ABR3NC90_9TELE
MHPGPGGALTVSSWHGKGTERQTTMRRDMCQRPLGQYPPYHTAVTDGTLTIAPNPQQAGLSHARLHPNNSTTIDTVTPGDLHEQCQKTVRRPYSGCDCLWCLQSV